MYVCCGIFDRGAINNIFFKERSEGTTKTTKTYI